MDFHKLQQTLNNIEPSDRARDIEKLKQAAQGNNSPAPKEPITESRDTAVVSAPTENLSEAEQFAALAGIQLDEKQKKGRGGQARGSDTMPKKTKPSRSGEQKHPLKDKLVGSSIDYEEQEVDEGPYKDIWDKAAKNANNIKAFSGVLDQKKKNKGSKKSSSTSQSAKPTPSSEGLPPNVSKALAPYGTALANVLKDPKKLELFKRLMKTADPNLAREAYEESFNKEYRTSSIKEDLLRRLNNKK